MSLVFIYIYVFIVSLGLASELCYFRFLGSVGGFRVSLGLA